MSIPAVRFNKQNQPEFFTELTKRVNAYFRQNNISKYANLNMKLKTAFMLTLYFLPLILMVTGLINSTGMIFLMWGLMGFGIAGLGAAVMHDANHGSYSRNARVNKALGYVITVIGGYPANWKIQHNFLHHSYTNIHGMDEDIELNVMRLSPDQPASRRFRFQAFYAPFLYGLLSIFWVTLKDFQSFIRFHKKDYLRVENITFAKGLTEIIIHKIWYIGLMVLLPMLVLPIPWWQTLLAFLMMHLIGGLLLSLIFQAAHVLEETHFTQPDENGSVENSWAIHQIRTTSNFAKKSRFFSWFIGGLNYQIEHH
ncbi:MAG: acyl-CoA desaturase, partial [Phaeodactylibacter sp.]|nr:acyl-CoA desaturase [Phaeodactylibacter sp.]